MAFYNKTHIFFLSDAGHSPLARFQGSEQSDGHNYDPAADLFGSKFFNEQVTEELAAKGFTGLELAGEVSERVNRVMTVRREMNFLYYSEEKRDTPEMTTRYVIMTDERDGKEKLYHPEFEQFADDMYGNYRRYLSETGRGAEFNESEHQAFLSMERSLVSGKARNVLVPVDHQSGVKYVNILSREGSEVVGKYVDVSLENSGNNFRITEVTEVLGRMTSGQGAWEINRDTGFSYFSSRENAVSVRALRDAVERHVIEKTMSFTFEPREQAVSYVRTSYDRADNDREVPEEHKWSDFVYVPDPVVRPEPESIAYAGASRTDGIMHQAGALIAMEELARMRRDEEPGPAEHNAGPFGYVEQAVRKFFRIDEQAVRPGEEAEGLPAAVPDGLPEHQDQPKKPGGKPLLTYTETVRVLAGVSGTESTEVGALAVFAVTGSLPDFMISGEVTESVAGGPAVSAGEHSEGMRPQSEGNLPAIDGGARITEGVTNAVLTETEQLHIPEGADAFLILRYLAGPELPVPQPDRAEEDKPDAKLPHIADTVFTDDTIRFLNEALRGPEAQEAFRDELPEMTALWILLFASARFLYSGENPVSAPAGKKIPRYPERLMDADQPVEESQSPREPFRTAVKEATTDSENVASFIFAFIFYLILTKSGRKTGAVHDLPDAELPKEEGVIPQGKESAGTVSPFILLSIIWHLAMIRESGMTQSQGFNMTKPPKKKKSGAKSQAVAGTEYGVIYRSDMPRVFYA